MRDLIIIGNGPAGISTALYTSRAGLKTTIIGKDKGALKKAHLIENYYGFKEPISGSTLIDHGIIQAKRLGTEFIEDEVVNISYDGKLIVKTKNKEYKAECVVLATGSNRSTPKIKGLKEFEGRGVSYCAVCDAFFYRQKNVAVIGNGEYALHEALQLLPTSKSVVLLTNGQHLEADIPEDISITINTKEIEAIDGNDVVNKVVFKDNTSIDVDGVFIAIGVAGSSELAKKIGAFTDGTTILVDENMLTNVPGLFAVGDCTGGLLQISKAVYEGAKAGTEIIKHLRKNRKNK